MDLEDLHVVVGDGNTARRLKGRVTLHFRVEQHGAEAAVALVVALEINLYLAHALEVVTDRALGALDFISQIILAAGRHTEQAMVPTAPFAYSARNVMMSSFSTSTISVEPAAFGRFGNTVVLMAFTLLMSPMMNCEMDSRWEPRSPSAPQPASLLM